MFANRLRCAVLYTRRLLLEAHRGRLAHSRSPIVEEVRSIANAIVSLISSIVGGLLVLAGQFLARRAEDRRRWLLRLHEAAGELAASYLQEAARVNDSRRSGLQKQEVDTSTYVVDRQKAWGRFRTLPWSSEFEAERREMGAQD
jgi:hypothetical protein